MILAINVAVLLAVINVMRLCRRTLARSQVADATDGISRWCKMARGHRLSLNC